MTQPDPGRGDDGVVDEPFRDGHAELVEACLDYGTIDCSLFMDAMDRDQCPYAYGQRTLPFLAKGASSSPSDRSIVARILAECPGG